MPSPHRDSVFDAHFHVFSPTEALIPNEDFIPARFPVASYLRTVEPLGVTGGALVASSAQGFEVQGLLASLERLGPGFVAVARLSPTVTDAELRRLDARGVRGIRFNLRRGGAGERTELETFAQRVFDVVGWHAELYAGADDLMSLHEVVARLPAVSIDHLGLDTKGLDIVLDLASRGVRVKATGFGRVDFDIGTAVRRLYDANPHALLFGTDLPSTRAERPFRLDDVTLLHDLLSEEEARRVLLDNALEFYRLNKT